MIASPSGSATLHDTLAGFLTNWRREAGASAAPAAGMSGQGAEPPKLGLAVSGGGDSVALLRLAAELAATIPLQLHVYTVDHGLRPEAAAEAVWVADLCRDLGLAHRSLSWRWDGRGNLSEAARHGRYGAIAAACQADGVADCLLAHTRDDNIETLFLGLLRGAGLDGLAGMRRDFLREGLRFHRPLLGTGREALRDYLRALGQGWHEDPTNTDLTHDRARVRHMLGGLDLPAERLAQSLAALAATRTDLGHELLARLADAVRAEGPVLVIAAEAFLPLTPEFRRRTLSAALKAVGGARHAPRAPQLLRLARRDWPAEPQPATLGGCRIWFARGALRLCREASAVPPAVGSGDLWDGWRAVGPHRAGLTLGALGAAGCAQVAKDWRAARIPSAAMIASPAVFDGETVVAAAFAALADGETPPQWRFEGPDLPASFAAAVMAH